MQAMEEKINSLFKSKTLKLVSKELNLEDVKDPKHKPRLQFELEDLGSAKLALNMEIRRVKWYRKLLLCHTQHMERLLLKFKMVGSKLTSVPLAPHLSGVARVVLVMKSRRSA